MYRCIYICIDVYIYIYTHTHTHTHKHGHLHTQTYIYIYIHTFFNIHTYIHICINMIIFIYFSQSVDFGNWNLLVPTISKWSKPWWTVPSDNMLNLQDPSIPNIIRCLPYFVGQHQHPPFYRKKISFWSPRWWSWMKRWDTWSRHGIARHIKDGTAKIGTHVPEVDHSRSSIPQRNQ